MLSETNPSVSFRYGYTGRERDLESGLDYYRARYYDSNVGRFISVDPMGFGAGDTNLYRYVGNNSTNATDPSGMLSLDDVGNYAYGGLENTDKFVAGFADLVTGGYTTKLRNDIYGDRVAGQHEGWLFNAGQVAGFGVSVALGFATPNALAGVGAAARVAQVYELAQAGKGAYDTTTKILDGKMDWSSPLSYLEVAGSFAPAIGFGVKQISKIGVVENALNRATSVAGNIWDNLSTNLNPNKYNVTRSYSGWEPWEITGIIDREGGLLRLDDGHQYAKRLIDGGSGRSFAGHGMNNGGEFTLPEGTSLSVWQQDNRKLPEFIARAIEDGNYEALAKIASKNKKVAEILEGAKTYLPGSTVPDYMLLRPDRTISVRRNSMTVGRAHYLSDMIEPGMGNLDWAACTECAIQAIKNQLF